MFKITVKPGVVIHIPAASIVHVSETDNKLFVRTSQGIWEATDREEKKTILRWVKEQEMLYKSVYKSRVQWSDTE